jgi:cytochrome c peroxidase
MKKTLMVPAVAALLGSIWACRPDRSLAPQLSADVVSGGTETLAETVRRLAAGRGITPLVRPPAVRPALVELGRALAFDKILSGNRDISCMTCHLPRFATGDGVSLSIGQGAAGLGPDRTHPDGTFIPRNAPALFNLFATNPLFWDGRVSQDQDGTFHTPAGNRLNPTMTRVLEFGAISALPLFPVSNRAEMRGNSGNELAAIDDKQIQQVWAALMVRLGKISEYRRMFEAAYPGTNFDGMTFAHASNAIGGFLVDQLAFTNSPWDRFLSGDDAALTPDQLAGAQQFMSIRCSLCHTGPAFSDNKFHNVAVAQIGPGLGNGPSGRDDFGRFRVTGELVERYAFRTTPLRNVVLTAPYGHDGSIVGLRDFIDHYSESHLKLRSYAHTQVPLLDSRLQGTLLDNFDAVLQTRDPIIDGVVLPPELVNQLTTFMSALTDPAAVNLDRIMPARVPSGLPIDGAP